jgi:hypothetical protein
MINNILFVINYLYHHKDDDYNYVGCSNAVLDGESNV